MFIDTDFHLQFNTIKGIFICQVLIAKKFWDYILIVTIHTLSETADTKKNVPKARARKAVVKHR